MLFNKLKNKRFEIKTYNYDFSLINTLEECYIVAYFVVLLIKNIIFILLRYYYVAVYNMQRKFCFFSLTVKIFKSKNLSTSHSLEKCLLINFI